MKIRCIAVAALASLARLRREDLLAFQRQQLRPESTTLILAGDLDGGQARALADGDALALLGIGVLPLVDGIAVDHHAAARPHVHRGMIHPHHHAAAIPAAVNAAVLTDLENGAASVVLKGRVLADSAPLGRARMISCLDGLLSIASIALRIRLTITCWIWTGSPKTLRPGSLFHETDRFG